jgi:hypothetical protein
MVWFFERHGAYIRIETRLRATGAGFELAITVPGESERLEYFDDEAALLARYEEVCGELTASGWGAPASWRV